MAVGKGIDRTAGKRVLAGLAVLGIVFISGLLAAWGVSPGTKHEISKRDISPADEVALRFPTHWNERGATDAAASPATFALASVSEARIPEARISGPRPYDSAMLFNPNPIWPVTAPAPEAATLARATAEPARRSAAIAAPKAESKAEIKAEIKPEPKAAPKAELAKTEAKPVVVASRSPAHLHHAVQRPRRESSVLFNDAQLASIKARLKLSDYQQQYWPAVAAALRAIGERAAREPVHVRQASAYAGEGPLSGINPDGPEVQQLKSAAFPLIMSMNEEQKNQVRTLARVMGLEQVASSF